MATKKNLPDKLSELLRLAVADARKIQRSRKYGLDMDVWSAVGADDKDCVFCMAGAVMFKTLGHPADNTMSPCNFGREIESKIFAINDMRKGDFEGAAVMVGVDQGSSAIRDASDEVDGAFDRVTRRAPWRTYLRAADILEKAGL